MLRNRSKFSQSNRRNVRKRNRRSDDQSTDSSSASHISDSSSQDYSSSEVVFDDSSDSTFEDESVSPVIGRRLKTRRKQLNSKSKRNIKVIHNRNCNSRSKKKPARVTDPQAAGPSRINNNRRTTKSGNSNSRTAKRKYKDRRDDTESSNGEVCNTSSEEFESPLFRIKKKRLRRAISNTDESDDSEVQIQTESTRRLNVLDSESGSEEIRTNGRIRNGGMPLWTDSNSDSVEFNSQETSTVESSGSSRIQNRRRRHRSVEYIGTSDSSGSSFSPFSNSLFSNDSETANITSVLDSEASSSYNTAQSTSSNNNDRNSKDQTSDSDSSDSDGEKCAICLKKFRNQLIGNPSNCDHNFCAPCLKKWSESSTTCPVDRFTFDSITIRSEINGPVVDKLKVENRNFGVFPPLDIDEVSFNDAINCEICGSGDDEETLLLCDLCNLGYHMACLRPPLSAIPAGAWYCPPCVDLRIDPTQNGNEAVRYFPDFPMGSLFLLSSAAGRPNRIRTNNNRSRPNGPLPRGRGPTRGFRSQNLSNFSNVIESVIADLNVETLSQNRPRRKRRNRQRMSTNTIQQQLTTAENSQTTLDAISRISRKVNQRMSSGNSNHIPRPRGPRDVVDMVFPSFSLFGGDDLDYFSEGPDEHGVEGEVAIMARVRNEYSARRLGNRKNIVTSLNSFYDRSRDTSLVEEITENASSVNLLDTILESQTLWHSKNVEIKSKKDGTLEIKRKDEQNKKPDLTNPNHSSKEIPLFPNKGDGTSDSKSYANSNNRYSSLGNSSGGSGNSFSSSTSSFNSLNPSTRPGFSNLLGNNSAALDLSPFRGAAPIRFRMNAPRPVMRRQNYNSNSQRPPSNSPANMINSVQSPKKSSTVGANEEEVDLYDDIETENAENEKSQEMFASLEPPPEPPALLIGSDSSSDDEDNGLVIDDKVVNKSNIYDPNEPNEDSDTENNEDKSSNIVPGYLRSPSYGGLSEFGPHLPLPEPPVPAPELRMELDSNKDSDEEEEAECPNMTLYSSTSMNLANNVQDIPIPDAAYPQDVLECIPIPTPGDVSNVTKENNASTHVDSKLYSPTDKNDSETSSIAEVEITSPKKQSPKRRDTSEIRSVSSRDSFREHSDRSSAEESDRSENYEKDRRRSSRRRSKDNVRRRRRSSFDRAPVIDLVQNDKPSKEIDLTEVDSNDEKDATRSDDESIDDAKTDTEENIDKYDIAGVSVEKEEEDNKSEKSGDEKEAEEKSAADAASVKSTNEDYKTASEDEDKEGEKVSVEDVDKEKTSEDTAVDTSLEVVDSVLDNDDINATSNDVNASGNYLLPSEDLDPVSDVEYNDFSECQRSSSIRDKRKKRKKTRRRDSSNDNKIAAEAKELEEGEIEEEKSKRKFSSQKKKARSETPERSPDRRLKKKRDRKEKTTGKENKETGAGGKPNGGAGGANADDLQWKKLSKNTKERNYRDGKAKPNDKSDKARDREIKSRKEKRKEIERYDVRKIVSERPIRDEFGRDISVNRSRSRTRSRSVSYPGRRRSKGNVRRSFSQGDRMIDWSPVRSQQRRSRSRTRRTRSRSRNRSRLSGDRYRNRSKNRDREREYDKREPRKRKRSLSSEINKYGPHPVELKKRHRSQDRPRKSGSYNEAPLRPRERDIPAEYYYERSRSWSRSLSYASLTPEPEQYVRYSRSPSIIEPPIRIPLVSPDRGHEMNMQNQQNLTVIVPNIDLSKKKHKKKKDSKKKKKKQPSKEVFTSGDNIVVSVNFDDNQKIISAKSSKRKHDDEKGRKKKKDETRKKRKQMLQVSDEVLNAKPVAVIDLNSSPCKEMSPTEVISLTDSGDETTVIIENAIPTDRRIVSSQEDTNKSPAERRAYVMTQSGPKTPPEPPIKFTVNSAAAGRPLPTNPIFEQDEIDGEDAMHYNKGPNTPPEPANQARRSRSPSATMYDPFEPTKSRSQSPENVQYDELKDATAGAVVEERRPVIDMFSEDNDKPTAENQSSGASAEKSKPQEDAVKENNTAATPTKVLAAEDVTISTNTKSPAKDASTGESTNETTQPNGVNTLVLDLSSLGDDFVPKSTIPLVKTSQGKYEFQSGKAPDKPITVVISQQSQPAKPQPQQVMVTPTRQVPTKPVEPMKQPVFPDLLSWKLPPPMSQTNFSTPPPTSSSLPSGNLVTPSKSAPGLLTQNGNQEDNSFEVDDSPYSPASSEGDDLFEPPPLNASTSSPNKQRPSPMPAVNSYKSRVDALFSSSPIKKIPPRSKVPPHVSKPVSAIKGTKKILKPPPPIPTNKKDTIRADEEQLKILDDVPNSAVEMMVKEKFLKKLHRQERVVEEVKVVLKPHYAKKHITKEEYKDILRKAVPKICHNKSGDINPSKIQGLVEAYVKKIRHAKKKPTMGAGAPLFPPMKTTGKTIKPWYLE